MDTKLSPYIYWTYNAIKRYLFRDTAYLLLYTYRYFQNNHHNNCKFYTEQEFVHLIETGKSIIRLGDGEIGLLHFLPIRYQVYSDTIRNNLKKIITDYKDNSNYILMIPYFVNSTNTELKKTNQFRVYRQLKITYELLFNKSAIYYDQLAFYKDGYFKKLILPYIQIKKVIIVTNAENKEKIIKSKLSSKEYLYVVCENENTYESRIKIQSDIIDIINKTGLPKKNFVILMSAGLSKTIIYDMCNKGYQLLDIGKGLESYYIGKSLEYGLHLLEWILQKNNLKKAGKWNQMKKK